MNSLESHVLRLVRENLEAPDVFLDTDAGIQPIRDSINDAIQELCMVTGSYRMDYHLGMVRGKQFYRLAPQNDYVGYIVEAWDRSRRTRLRCTDLLALTSQEPNWMDIDGPAEQYIMLGLDHVAIVWRPSASGAVIELKCVCIPKPYASQYAQIKLREQFQRVAVYLAVSEFYASRGDAGRATEYLKQYLEMAGIMSLHPQTNERLYELQGGQRGGRWQAWASTTR